ncbi:MAG: serine hydrolase [Terrisporobacter sp.]|uniref:D-alanyl-D-alanine carboxypeptidase family protein n=1 Tax=Terrisporobacter sp. TaxID=1965305 RepID=UPI002FC9FFB7
MKIKKLICMILVITILFISSGASNLAQAATSMPTVSSHAYVIMDSNSGNILYSSDPDKKIYPASTVKLLTALVAMENCDLSKKMTIDKNILSKIPYGAYVVDLKAGYTYTLEELLNMLLVSSAADAADTIAVGVAGSKEKFAMMMNKRAKSLGLENSSFDNAIGRDGENYPNTYSTAHDIAKLTRYTMTIPLIREIVAKPEYMIKKYDGNDSKTILNSNRFLRGQPYDKKSYKIIGGKTGTTLLCGNSLTVSATTKDKREVICSFFGNDGKENMYIDIEKLLTATFKNYKKGKIELEKGYVDTRYSDSREIINKYIDKNILKTNSLLTFNPEKKASKKTFIKLCNEILDTSYEESKSKEDITLLDMAKLLSNYKVEKYSIRTKLKYWIKLSHTNEHFTDMVHLYELDVLPSDYSYKEKSTITRAEMMEILDSLSKIS